ncbi:MAG: hypothetical protein VX777_06765 [Chlamydiota bacterium]|nr:hypothetical protein [Chlamydiota bacterium]
MNFFKAEPSPKPQKLGWEDYAREYREFAKTKAKQWHEKLSDSQELQEHVIGGAKAVAEVSVLAFAPHSFIGATTGAVIAAINPEKVAQINKVIDGGVNGAWKDLSFEVKLATVAVVVFAAYLCFPLFSAFSTLYSVKLGAGIAVRNINNEVDETRQVSEKKKKLY